MYNEVFARAVLTERARERDLSLRHNRIHGGELRPVRRHFLRTVFRFPALAWRALPGRLAAAPRVVIDLTEPGRSTAPTDLSASRS
jgi:hypothetical protein